MHSTAAIVNLNDLNRSRVGLSGSVSSQPPLVTTHVQGHLALVRVHLGQDTQGAAGTRQPRHVFGPTISTVHCDSGFSVECVTHGKSSARDSTLSITRESEALLVPSLHFLRAPGPRAGIGHRNVAKIVSFNELFDPIM